MAIWGYFVFLNWDTSFHQIRYQLLSLSKTTSLEETNIRYYKDRYFNALSSFILVK